MRRDQDGHRDADEETALLSASPERKPVKTPTPLPRLQIFILLLMQLAEPITSQCIYPFINQVCVVSPYSEIRADVLVAHL